MRLTVATLLALLCPAGIARGEGEIDLVGYESDRFDLSLDSATLGSASNTISAGDFIDPRQLEFTGWSYDVEVTASELTGFGGDLDYFGGVKLTVGQEQSEGSGVRGRLWAFGGAVETRNYPYYVNESSELVGGTLNLDLYQRVWAGQTSILFSIGPQFGSMRLFESRFDPVGIDALGFGAGIEVRRTLIRTRESELALLGHGRIGYMRGATHTRDHSFDGIGRFNTTDYGIGLEWRRRFDSGDLIVNGGYSIQEFRTSSFGYDEFQTASVGVGFQW